MSTTSGDEPSTSGFRFAAAFEHAPLGMALVAADGAILDANSALCEMLGLARDACAAAVLVDALDPADRPLALAAIQRVAAGQLGSDSREVRVVRPDGSRRWALLAISASGAADTYIVQLVDITGRKDAEERLAHQALHDALTDLPNRVLFLDRLALALMALERRPGMVAVLFLDLDGFKSVNDTLGHARGDELLRQVAHRLRHTVRAADSVARFGGDEFAVLVRDLDGEQQAIELAERVATAIRRPVRLGDDTITVSASIGIVATAGGADAGELLRRADVAMYDAKGRADADWAVYPG